MAPPRGPVLVPAAPCCYGGRITYRHSHQPAMPETAIPQAPISNVKNVAHDAERRSLLLDRCIEVDPVVCSCRLHVHGPAGIYLACIHIKRSNKMFYRLS